MLRADELRFTWPGAVPLGPLSFAAQTGEIIGVFGRSGTGKTTLFRILAGELVAHDGKVFYNGGGKRVYHDQLQKVVPWFSAKSNSLLSFKENDLRVRDDEIQRIFQISGISEFEDRDASRLSGGQRARVTLARSLLEKADILFLDEPFTGVDALSQELLVEELPEILKKRLTFITAHDPGVLVLLSTRILCLKQREDRIEGYFHNFRSKEFGMMSPANRRSSKEYVAEVQGLLESLYE